MAAHMQKCFRLPSVFLRYDSLRPTRIAAVTLSQRRQFCKNVDDKTILSSEPSGTDDGKLQPDATTDLKTESLHQSPESINKDASSSSGRDKSLSAVQEKAEKSFREAFEEYTSPEFLSPKEPEKVEEPFASMFRKSKFVDLGNPKGRIVHGKVFHVVDNDLYVDFGWKFHCVVQKPVKDTHLFVRNAVVRLRINELELSTRFLGETKDLTLNEADCSLLGLVSSPLSQKR